MALTLCAISCSDAQGIQQQQATAQHGQAAPLLGPIDEYARAKLLLEVLLRNVASHDPARAVTGEVAKKQRVERIGGCYGVGTLVLPAVFQSSKSGPSVSAAPAPINDAVHLSPLVDLELFISEAELVRSNPPASFNLLSWWKCRVTEGKFAVLGPLARLLLGIRPTSVDPERNFSEAGNLLAPKRSRMKPAKAEAVLMVKSNSDLITDPTAVPSLTQKQAMSRFPVLFSADVSDSESASSDSEADDDDVAVDSDTG
jgi:hAT family C-terminal dimerisation region